MKSKPSLHELLNRVYVEPHWRKLIEWLSSEFPLSSRTTALAKTVIICQCIEAALRKKADYYRAPNITTKR